jgi:hypothetical protein
VNVQVFGVSIPAMSTIGYGQGLEVESGNEIHFLADHRAIRYVGEILQNATELPRVYIEPWQIM